MTRRVALQAAFAAILGHAREQARQASPLLPQARDLRFTFGAETETITLSYRNRSVTFTVTELFDALEAPK